MNMREIKAYVHRNRIADVVTALYDAGYRNLTVVDVEGMLKALDSQEQSYSVAIGQKVITEVKLELVCEDENHTAEAIKLIQQNARTGQSSAGWIYVSELLSRIEISD